MVEPDIDSAPMPSGRRVNWAGIAGAICIVIGALVLVGWVTDQDILRTFVPGGIMMLPNPAVAFVVGGIALWLLRSEDASPRARRAARLAGVFVLLLGVLTFVERIFDVSVGIDMLLFPEAVRLQPYRPFGRMATNSTVALSLAGAGLLLMDVETRRKWRPAQLLATLGLVIASLALVGHLYNARPLYAIDRAAVWRCRRRLGSSLFTLAFSSRVRTAAVLHSSPARTLAAYSLGVCCRRRSSLRWSLDGSGSRVGKGRRSAARVESPCSWSLSSSC
jgi:hypothetical protein